MKWANRQRIKVLLIALMFVATLGVFLGWLNRRAADKKNAHALNRSLATEPASPTPASPLAQATPSPESSPTASADSSSPFIQPAGLIIPVAGVKSDQLLDTFSAARGEGRVHDAIDIPAPQGTPVLAAASGKILKLFQSKAGGTTIYQLSTDEKFIYYYAHLDRYADGVQEGLVVMQGQTIAYVGDTGNAGPGNYHLHFSIAIASEPKRWWEGVNINPYPLLRK
jgi:peptidoglycan LD-endopeptidase LytH